MMMWRFEGETIYSQLGKKIKYMSRKTKRD
jgi:hypothetical protein